MTLPYNGRMGRRMQIRDGYKYTGMFRDAVHKELADVVTMTSLKEAKKASDELVGIYNKSKKKDYKLSVKRATVLASNRAKVLAKRVHNPLRRNELFEISKLYYDAYKKMK